MPTPTGISHLPRARPSLARCVIGGRLVYYRTSPDENFWEDHWDRTLTPDFYSEACAGHLGALERPFLKHLPKSGAILEAGCGLGQVVLALRARGRDCQGVEWSERTVARVRQLLPDLPVRSGDVTALPDPDGRFAAIISLGVVEHRDAGPEPFLKEAHRVLAPGGILLISVPHHNALRRLKGSLGLYDADNRGLPFYQYAFRPSEFRRLLEAAGFRVLARHGYDAERVLRGELPWLRSLLARPTVQRWLRRALRRLPFVERALGHMMLFAAVRLP